MSTRAAAPRRARAVAPRAPRRVSGPARPRALPAPSRADARRLDRLLRSRACIWVVGIALLGLVFLQVSLLKLNTGISRAVQASATLERQNAELEEQISSLSATAKVRTGATAEGMVGPLAGEVSYLNVRPEFDAQRALRVMRPPSEQARELMRSDGVLAAPDPAATVAP